MSKWVIVGCGYSGERLARRLLGSGHEVIATTRSSERAQELGVRLQRMTVRVIERIESVALASLIPAGSIVVDSIPPTATAGDTERTIAESCAEAGARRLIYLSSTGVYGRGDGGWTDEETPTNPLGERGQRRLAAETALLQAAREQEIEAVALRIAGIYGPGRGVVARLLRGEYRIYGAGDSLVSRIHVDDLVSAIAGAGELESLNRPVYCVADNEPTSSRDFANGAAGLLGLAPPSSVPIEQASAAARAMLGANRRISNSRVVEELRLLLRYPSWREGVASLVSEARTAGTAFKGTLA